MPKKDDDLQRYIEIIVAILIVGALIWGYIIQPLILAIQSGVQSLTMWFQQNIFGIAIGFIAILALIIFIYILNRRSNIHELERHRVYEIQQEQERQREREYKEQLQMQAEQERLQKEQALEREKIAKGYRKYIDRFGKEKWGTPSDVKEWKEEDMEARLKVSSVASEAQKTTQFDEIIKAIEEFRPSRRHRDESGYHFELQGWLSSRFPNSKVELQTGGSRPDIVIGKIAIEVKGPTDDRAVKTLAEKYVKYLNYYENLIYVLFEPCYSERKFKDIREGIEKDTRVKIIIKNQCPQCMTLMPEGARFCINCGVSLEV